MLTFTKALALRRSRSIWTDSVRRYRTLQSFSETELDGGKDLSLAARRVSDADLRLHLERHAKDEERHAALFRTRAAEVKADAARGALAEDESDRAWDISRGRGAHDGDAHGFFHAGLFDELGEVAYVAMLHVAECRAAELFALHRDGAASDPQTQRIFEEILKDEKYHVAYTKKFLDKWSAQGRTSEVSRGLRAAKGSRLLGAWRRLGLRSGATFSRAVLLVLYWTLLLPFGLLARGKGGPTTRVASRNVDDLVGLRGQY